MYRMPSRRRKVEQEEVKINLVPMVDAVFNIIFFILITSVFVSMQQISSPLPILSSKPPLNEDKKPLALTLSIDENKVVISSGIPMKVMQTFNKEGTDFPWDAIHLYLIELKKKYPHEDSAIIEPDKVVAYAEIIKLMDVIRILSKNDEPLYGKDEAGVPVKLGLLFSTVIFGNITG